MSICSDITKVLRTVDAGQSASEFLTPLEIYVLVLEDRRFFYHLGVDPISVLRALLQSRVSGRVQGVSTIEQQLVRTVLDSRARTIRRKTREMMIATVLSLARPKRDILGAYLRCAYFGTNLTGSDAAMGALLGSRATGETSATCASMLKYPLGAGGIRESILRRAHYAMRLRNAFADAAVPSNSRKFWKLLVSTVWLLAIGRRDRFFGFRTGRPRNSP